MPDGFLRAHTSKYRCTNCKRCLADCRFNGIGFQFARARPTSKPKLIMRICMQCRSCDEIGTIGVDADSNLWEQCQAHVLRCNCLDPFGPSSVAHIPAMAAEQPTAQPGKSTDRTKRKKTKRKRVVSPSIRCGTPDTPITWDEQRKFLRQTSFRRSTKTFRKWIERMRPDEPTDHAPPF